LRIREGSGLQALEVVQEVDDFIPDRSECCVGLAVEGEGQGITESLGLFDVELEAEVHRI
jgi:hypothetical protein